MKLGAPSDQAPTETLDAMEASRVPGPDPLSLRSSSEYELLMELEFEVLALRYLMSIAVSEIEDAGVVKDCASHVDPDAVLHAPSFIWVKRLVVPASTRSPGALSPARAPRATAAITKAARIGRTRIPYSRISFTVIGNSLDGQIVFNPRGLLGLYGIYGLQARGIRMLDSALLPSIEQ